MFRNKRPFIWFFMLCFLFLGQHHMFYAKEKENSFSFFDMESKIVVEISSAKGIERIPLEQYILGILPEVMPISYNLEALKAQAVILRTQLIWEFLKEGKVNADEEITWLSMEKLEEIWKEEYPKNSTQLKKAVEETKGIYLTYQGEPILASYFYVSNQSTRNGNEVFSNQEYDYLEKTACERDFLCEEYLYQLEITSKDFWRKLEWQESKIEELQFSYDSSNYCIEVFNSKMEERMSGEEFRKLLFLPSASFHIDLNGPNIIISGKGKGHGLGMSQYGANEMAKEGKNFMTILSYFYKEITFDKFE